MSEPFAIVPLALAASGGRVDDIEAVNAVAAGFTLLQRCAPLVRQLGAAPAAILLPNSAQLLTAWAACEGRGARLLSSLPPNGPAERSHVKRTGAVFTVTSLARRISPSVMMVLLDDAPRTARVVWPDGDRLVDLGSHFGIDLEGDHEASGRDEVAVVFDPDAGSALHDEPGEPATHRELLAAGRRIRDHAHLTPADCVLATAPFSGKFGLAAGLIAPLLVGASVTTAAAESVTVLVADANVLDSPMPWHLPNLRLVIAADRDVSESMRDRWSDTTRVELTTLSM